jgi:hypothetical protein
MRCAPVQVIAIGGRAAVNIRLVFARRMQDREQAISTGNSLRQILVASLFGETSGRRIQKMDALNGAGLGARRNEDIALDLFKYVAATAGVGKTASPSTGFVGGAATKPDEHVTQLLELYSRCLRAVEGK